MVNAKKCMMWMCSNCEEVFDLEADAENCCDADFETDESDDDELD